MNKIEVPYGVVAKLEKIFGVSHVTIRHSLRGDYKGIVSEEKAKRIREAAKKNGGYEVQKVN